MTNNINTPTAAASSRETWLDFVQQMDWTRSHCQRSARVAISKAIWLGLQPEESVQDILEHSFSHFIQNNPQLLFAIWRSIAEEVELARQPAAEWLLQV